MIVPFMRNAPKAQVFVGSQPCRFGMSVFDALRQAQVDRTDPFVTDSSHTSDNRVLHYAVCQSASQQRREQEQQQKRQRRPSHYDRMLTRLPPSFASVSDALSLEQCAPSPDHSFSHSQQPSQTDPNAGDTSLATGKNDTSMMAQQQQQTRQWIPFGRARDFPTMSSMPCPTTQDAARRATEKAVADGSLRKEFVQLAVVGIPMDDDGRILITRRPRYMRSFPGAWVLPGGTLEPNESILDAVCREVKEETGLIMDRGSIQPTCIWESVYPTMSEAGTPIKAHHIVVYCRGKVSVRYHGVAGIGDELDLCPEEVECAVWASREQCQRIISASMTPSEDELMRALQEVKLPARLPAVPSTPFDTTTAASIATATALPSETAVGMNELVGIYPRVTCRSAVGGSNSSSPDVFGLAQGSLFALEELFMPPCEYEYSSSYDYQRPLL